MTKSESTYHENIVARKYQSLGPLMDERVRRLWAATEARALGYGGETIVSRATGLSIPTIKTGLDELEAPTQPPGRVRQKGGGRKSITETDQTLEADLESLIEPNCRGDPQSPLQWVSKSLSKLKEGLEQLGHRASIGTLWAILHRMGFSLQANRKTNEGASHPDRDEQFLNISEQTKRWQAQGQPVISVDCKKKELIGDFSNNGREWHPKGQPEPVRVHDFPDPELGKALPYGVYDITNNQALVNVGIDHDTAEFAVASIERWWEMMGKERFPEASDLMIVGDGGGSNGSRNRLWKVALQRFANKSGLQLHICHLPPGTSKWNKIEHRLFAYITLNWRGRPLVSLETIVNLIANTTTQNGLNVKACIDQRQYPTKVEVTEQQLQNVKISREDFHGEWNYNIQPV